MLRSTFSRLTPVLAMMAVAVFAGTLFIAAPSRGRGAEGTAPVRVVTTIFPYADMVRAIGGDYVHVTHLLPPGASPHAFEPRPSQLREAARADLIVWNGAGLDDWVRRLAAPERRDVGLLQAADHVPLLPWGDGHDGAVGEHDHDRGNGTEGDHHHHGPYDPHLWLDPIIVRDYVAPRIAQALTDRLPSAAPAFEANLAAYQDALTKLDEEIRRATAPLTLRRFIAHHSAWRYFAARYDLEEAAVLSAIPGQEPSARWLADLVTLTQELGVTTVFAEPQLNPQAAQTIAEEIGGRVVFLDPLGDPSLPGRDSYIALMRFNLQAVLDGLGPGDERPSR